ncbi:MAG: ABC transporter ATP-binding protein [Gammaproteobacteria bacterium]|nr:ABC transporter ATP-binding protein [Gammaproteobacteria bacterium]
MMIVAEGVSKAYGRGSRSLVVLRDIDLRVPEEDFIALVGPSGSGKTTLLGLLAGLDAPTTGSVSLGGERLSALTADQRAAFRAQKVGFVFQTFHLLPTLTALENVMVPLELAPRATVAGSAGPGSRVRPRVRARELLERVGLAERMHHYPAQLSGGEQQRVALARAFANRPLVLFADEPTGNLDSAAGAMVVELMEELNRECRTTIVLATHDLELAARARRVITLRDGRITSDRRNGHPGSPNRREAE